MEKLTVGILVFEDVEVLDFSGPFEVFTVAKTRDTVNATGGLTVKPHYGFDDAPKIDLLLVPGGFGTRPLMNDADTIDWIKRASAEAQLTTSVCTGSLLLAQAGLLDGRRATTHWAALDLLESLDAGVTVVRDVRYVDDGIISSAGVSAGIDMAFYVVEKLHGKAVADETAHYIDYPRAEAA